VLFNKDKTTLIQAPGALFGIYTIPGRVTTIGDGAFMNCASLTSVTIPDFVTTIESHAFYSCSSLISVTIGESVTIIEEYAFSNCDSLTSVAIGESVTTIRECAFSTCDHMVSITIPASVTTIESNAFDYCYDLRNVYYADTQAQWEALGYDDWYYYGTKIHYNHTHDYTRIPPVTVDATCTKGGYINYTCMHGETYREILPATGHRTGSNARTIAPTCTEQGYTVSTCPDCGETANTDYIAALGHDFTGEMKETAPSCTEEGYTGLPAPVVRKFRKPTMWMLWDITSWLLLQ